MNRKKTYQLEVNGFQTDAEYAEEDIRTIFLPLLRACTDLSRIKKKRILVLMAAPPGTGKTTLSLLLEYLSKTSAGLKPVQAVGLDGFHYRQKYLNEHTVMREGKRVRLAEIKGAAETFDLQYLIQKLGELECQTRTGWPVYDRNLHDVSTEEILVDGEIVFLEGNWLLLGNGGWEEIKSRADLSIRILADEKFLKKRLISRKIRGGLKPDAARDWYEKSDGINVRRVLGESQSADLEIELMADGRYRTIKSRGVL